MTIIKDGVINLAGKELDKNKIRFLNLGTKFIQTYNRQPPYLGIIQTTEIYMTEQASAYEKQGRTTIACLERIQACEKSHATHQVGVCWRAMIIPFRTP